MPRARVLIFGWADRVHVQRWAAGLKERDYLVKVVSHGGEPIEGIETVCFPRGGKLSYIRLATSAAEEARKFQPDLVHVHYAGGFGLWAVKAGLRPTVISVWGADIMDLPKKFYYRVLIKRTLRAATAITATSKLLKTVAVKLVPQAENKISVISFGVNLPALLAPPEGAVRLCFIKAHRRKYGPDILLKAMSLVRRQISDIQLTMAGAGEMTEELRKMIADLGLQDNVRMVGFIPNKEIPKLIQDHHIMVMPSVLESESFGVAVLEASACGRPVIASNVGGVPEVLVDNVTGILVPKNDVNCLAEAIVKLARDAELRTRLGRAGHAFVKQNYTWDKSLDMMTDLYERLIHEKR